MAADSIGVQIAWRDGLPVLTGRLVTLREPAAQDLAALVDVFSVPDASRFGTDEPVTEMSVLGFIERAAQNRAAGAAFAYVITPGASRSVTGLIEVKQLDLSFEAAEWDMTLVLPARGTGAFLEAARLVGSFAFGAVGVHRLEARVLVQNGRANGALRKLGAVQEGILRRSTRRGGEYVDQVLWSVLKEDWNDHWMSTGPRVH
jgi:RimJ/RimL family protein N-acetyltransferase